MRKFAAKHLFTAHHTRFSALELYLVKLETICMAFTVLMTLLWFWPTRQCSSVAKEQFSSRSSTRQSTSGVDGSTPAWELTGDNSNTCFDTRPTLNSIYFILMSMLFDSCRMSLLWLWLKSLHVCHSCIGWYNKKLRYCEEHSVSVVLSWCT